MKTELLNAAKATNIPTGAAGLWHIKKIKLSRNVIAPKDGKLVEVPSGEYTQLWRWTNETVQHYLDDAPPPTYPRPQKRLWRQTVGGIIG